MLANSGAMSTFVGAFDVTSKLTGKTYQCRFSHMWNGIATRHADTIDTKFYVDGVAHVVGLAHTAFVTFRDRTGRDLTDREAASSPPNICASGSRKRTSGRSTTSSHDGRAAPDRRHRHQVTKGERRNGNRELHRLSSPLAA